MALVAGIAARPGHELALSIDLGGMLVHRRATRLALTGL
jgi:hypothetical protein